MRKFRSATKEQPWQCAPDKAFLRRANSIVDFYLVMPLSAPSTAWAINGLAESFCTNYCLILDPLRAIGLLTELVRYRTLRGRRHDLLSWTNWPLSPVLRIQIVNNSAVGCLTGMRLPRVCAVMQKSEQLWRRERVRDGAICFIATDPDVPMCKSKQRTEM